MTKLNEARFSGTISYDTKLAPLTSFGIGGKAPYSFYCKSSQEINEAAHLIDYELGLPLFVLGGGTNVLVDSADLSCALIIDERPAYITVEENKNQDSLVYLHAGGSLDFDELVAFCCEHELAGLSALSGIPGKACSAPVQNIGAYGQELAPHVESLLVYDRLKPEQDCILSAEQLDFSYRSSLLKRSVAQMRKHFARESFSGRYIVKELRLKLKRCSYETVYHKELAQALNIELGQSAKLSDIRSVVREIRSNKGTLFKADIVYSHGAGSFFTNPIIDEPKLLEKLKHSGAPLYPLNPLEASVSAAKCPAAWLIEQAGIPKGFSLHDGSQARVSPLHVLTLYNEGTADSAEILELRDYIQEQVYKHWGISLVMEPSYIF